jgi:TPR repeat protein
MSLALPAWADFEAGLVAYENGDYGKALEIWTPLAEQDNARAQLSIGVLHEQGDGVPQDPGRAAIWYERSAKLGLSDAQFRLGLLHYDGAGVKKDAAPGSRRMPPRRRNGLVAPP